MVEYPYGMMKLCAGDCSPKARIPTGRTYCGPCGRALRERRAAEGRSGQNGVRRDPKVREHVIARDLRRCVACNRSEVEQVELFGIGFEVHHRDGDPKNNSFLNLETRCTPCHDDADEALRRAKERRQPRTWREAREAL